MGKNDKPLYNADIISKIKELCAVRGITPNKAFTECGLGKDFIYNLGNHIEPSALKLMKIAQYFSVSTDYLLGLTEKPNANATPQGNVNINNRKKDTEISEQKELLVQKEKLLSFFDRLTPKAKKGIRGQLYGLCASKTPDFISEYNSNNIDGKIRVSEFNRWAISDSDSEELDKKICDILEYAEMTTDKYISQCLSEVNRILLELHIPTYENDLIAIQRKFSNESEKRKFNFRASELADAMLEEFAKELTDVIESDFRKFV